VVLFDLNIYAANFPSTKMKKMTKENNLPYTHATTKKDIDIEVDIRVKLLST